MNKELNTRIETMISTARHVFSTSNEVSNGGRLSIDPMHIYLLEKIEELQSVVAELELKLSKFRTTKNNKPNI